MGCRCISARSRGNDGRSEGAFPGTVGVAVLGVAGGAAVCGGFGGSCVMASTSACVGSSSV